MAAKPWAEVAKDPSYLALSPEDREAARQSYFSNVVAPHIDTNDLEAARAQFDQDTLPKSRSIPGQIYDFVKDALVTTIGQESDQSGSVGGDLGRSLGKGIQVDIPQALVGLGAMESEGAKHIPFFGPLLSLTMNNTPLGGIEKAATDWITGKLNDRAKQIDESFTDRSKEATQKTFFTPEASFSNLTKDGLAEAPGKAAELVREGKFFGPGWTDILKISHSAVESLPSTIVTMGPTARISRATYEATFNEAITRGATEEAAQQLAEKAAEHTAMLVGGAAEGIQGGGQQWAQTYSQVMDLPQSTVEESPEYRKAYDSLPGTLSEEDRRSQAKQIVASKAADVAFVVAGVSDAILGGLGDKYLGTAVAGKGSRIGSFARGAAQEGATEFAQSGLEQFGTNLGVRQYADPNQPLLADVGEQAVGGAFAGAATGGAFGAAFHRGAAAAEKEITDKVMSSPDLDTAVANAANAASAQAPLALPAPTMIASPEGDVGTEAQLAERARVLGVTPDIERAAQMRAAQESQAALAAGLGNASGANLPGAQAPLALPAPRVLVDSEGQAATEAQLNNKNVLDDATRRELGISPDIQRVIEAKRFDDVLKAGNRNTPTTPQSSLAIPDATPVRPSKFLQLLAEHGGISRAEAQAQGIDPAHFSDATSRQVFGKPLFPKTGGMTLDQAAELASQFGYGSNNYSANELLVLLDKSLRGEKIVSRHQSLNELDSLMETERERYYSDVPEQPAFHVTPTELAVSGFNRVDDQTKRLTALFTLGRQQMGDQAFDDLLERTALQHENISDDEFESLIRTDIENHAKSKAKAQVAATGTEGGRNIATPGQVVGTSQGEEVAAKSVREKELIPGTQAGKVEAETTNQTPPQGGVSISDKLTPVSKRGQVAERRQDTQTRKRVSDMTPEELQRELLTDPLTGLPNRRAYDESQKKPVQVAIDVDSLKWVNDNLGHDAGDQMLKVVGQALREQGVEAYHISGDEFMVQATDPGAVERDMQTVVRRLDAAVLEAEAPDGSVITKTGVHFSYGIGATRNEADQALNRAKGERESQGLRAARGQTPPGVQRTTSGEQTKEDNPPTTPKETVSLTPSQEGVSVSASEKSEKLTPVSKRGNKKVETAVPASTTSPLDAHSDFMKRVHDGQVSADDFKQHFNTIVSKEKEVIDALSKLTKTELLSRVGPLFVSRYRNEPKARLVSAIFDDMLSDFALGEPISFGMGSGDYRAAHTNAVRRIVENTTDETLKKFADKVATAREERKQRVAATIEAVKDPKTLEDFETFLRVKKRSDLTQEQRERYDELRAEKSRSERKADKARERTTVLAAGATTGAEIIETKHTRDGHDLFVVKPADRVDRDVYNAWNTAAKKLGGYYSSFRGNGAIPGFQFKTRESAEAFQKFVSGGDTAAVQEQAKARRDAFEDDRSQTAAERLREMGNRLDERADESLGQERKANTERRARMAANAEAAANYQKSMAATMRNIAQAIEDGKAKFLDQVRQKVQVEMLNSFITAAKYRQLREKYKDYSEYEKHQHDKPTAETIEHAEWPTYTAYRSDLARLGRELLEVDGLKQVGQSILKVADDVTDAYTKFAKDNLHDVARYTTKTGERPVYGTRDAAEEAIIRSGYKGKAISIQIKRGQHMIVMSPSEAQRAGLWQGDDDKRITLKPDFAANLVEKAARRANKNVTVPHQFQSAYELRKRLAAMGIETPAEFRSALREFIKFREAPPAPDKVKLLERKMVGRRKDGLDFFPTPADVADEMVTAADIKDGMTVLEPSAGMGHIADRLREAGFEPDVIELSGDRRELLEAKGYTVVGTDFLDIQPRTFFTYGDTFRAPDGTEGIMRGAGGLGSGRVRLVDASGSMLGYFDRDELEPVKKNGTDSGYDRIIMNPPFSDRRDMDHVRHAYELLKPGGRLVAIVGEGIFFGSDKKATEFREWLDRVGGTDEKLEEGTFQDPSLPVNTGANARMVVIDKPLVTDVGSDDSEVVRSRGPSQSSDAMSVSEIADVVREATADFAHEPDVFVIDHASEILPPSAINDDTDGFTYNGRIYLVRSMLRDAVDVERVLFHELFHYGVRRFLTQEQYIARMGDLYLRDAWIRRQADTWVKGPEGGALKDAGRSSAYIRARGVDEALAELGSDIAKTESGFRNTDAKATAIRAVVRWLAKLADFLGMKNAAAWLRGATNEEARTFVHSMFSGLRTNAPATQGDGDFRSDPTFSRMNPASWDAPEPSKLDALIYKLQDKHIDTKRVLEAIRKASGVIKDSTDAYLQEELFHGRAAKGVSDFLDMELRPLLTEMVARKVSMEELEKYLQARHAPERNEQIAKINPDMPDGGSGMTTKDANDYLAKIDPNKRRVLDALAKRVDDINKKTREELVSYGLESPETIKAWEQTYKHYVPLQREDMEGGPGIGQGFSVRGSASKRATGSNRAVVDILANIAMQRERVIVRGEKNRVANALVGLAAMNPNTDFWRVDQPPRKKVVDERTGLVTERTDPLYKSRENVVVARIPDKSGNVVEHAVIFNEHDERAMRMAQALKNVDTNDLGEVIGTVAKMTRYFAAMNTQYNPVFGITNLIRDAQSAVLNLGNTELKGHQRDVMKSAIDALRGIYIDARAARKGEQPRSSWAELWDEFQREGGQTGYRDMFRTSKDRAEAIQREISHIEEGKAKQVGRVIFDWLSDFNLAIENSIRLAAYKVGKDNGLSNPQSASIAKNLTVNFNRKGQLGTQAGALYAFFNANVQGTARLLQTLTGPAGKKIIYGGMLLGVMQALLLAAAGFDDNDPPEFVRERNIIIPVGSKKYLMIPLSLGFHILPNLGRIPTEFVLNGFRDKSKRIVDIFNIVADAFNPIGNAGLSMQTIAPTVLDPLAALAENKDWTGKPIAREDSSNLAPTPGYTRAKDTASTFSKAISKAINFISGGTRFTPGIFSPTPDQIDYLIGQITGGVGRELMKVEQAVTSRFTGEDLPTYKIPLVGKFYGNSEDQSQRASVFYDNLKLLNEHEAEIKGRARAHEPVADYLRDHPEARLFAMGNAAETQVSELNRKKRELVDKGASQDRIKLIDQRIQTVMQRVNDAVKNAKQGSGR